MRQPRGSCSHSNGNTEIRGDVRECCSGWENNRPALLMDSQAKHVTVAAGVSDLLMRFPPDGQLPRFGLGPGGRVAID